MSKQPEVSIITINYNSERHTLELIESLKSSEFKNFEIIVVDNASIHNPEKEIAKCNPEVIFIRSETNLGFAGGNNLGIERSRGQYLFFLNNDTMIAPDLINSLIDRFERSERFGVLSPKILFYDSDRTIQYAGFTEMNWLTARNELIGCKEKDVGQYDEFREVAYPHGAAMMVKREVVDQVGVMPEDFFLYYEELDWAESIKRQGYKIGYEPRGEVYHKESMSVGKLSPLKAYYLNRNRILFMRRNAGSPFLWLFMLFYTFFALPKNVLVAENNAIRFAILRAFRDATLKRSLKEKRF